jgi:hypothetical protein
MTSSTKALIILFLAAVSPGFTAGTDSTGARKQVQIQWAEKLGGDFSFQTQWSYPEGVFRNESGQLSCDGFCPEGIYAMMKNGRIIADSIDRFYPRVDTSHQFHTIECEASCYEWAGADFIKAEQQGPGAIRCYTLENSATHCSLILEITGDRCIPRIELRSIASPGIMTYHCTGGYLKIDKGSWKQRIIKAEFNFDFFNSDEPDNLIFWKGKIFAKIENRLK